MSGDGPPYDYSGPEDEDPVILSPQVQEVAFDTRNPLFQPLTVTMVSLIEAAELDIVPPDALPVPGVEGAYLSALPDNVHMIEYHATKTPKGRPAFYVARIIDPDDFLRGF